MLYRLYRHGLLNEPDDVDSRVRPFNFMLALRATALALATSEEFLLDGTGKTRRRRKKSEPPPKPIAPYSSSIAEDAKFCFDRETGKPVDSDLLSTYRSVLAQYHLSPESKFLNGEPFDSGPTQRRHVVVAAIHHIGKEANKWEEQHYLGFDEGEQIEYGSGPEGLTVVR